MGIDDTFSPRVEGSRAPGEAAPEGPRSVGRAEFRRLLERLERLASPGEKVEDAGDLQRAMRSADEDFVVAMELRRMLEAAYRERTR